MAFPKTRTGKNVAPKNIDRTGSFCTMPKNLSKEFYNGLRKQYEDPKSLMHRKVQLVSQQISGGSILLDIGCGTGDLILRNKLKFKGILGIDISSDAVDTCRERFRESHRIEFILSDATRLPFNSGSFDCITALDCLEHLDNPDLTISEVFRVLVSRGKFIVTTPNWYDKVLRRIRPGQHKNSHSSLGWKKIIQKNQFSINNIRTVAFPIIDRDSLSRHLHVFGKCVLIVAEKASSPRNVAHP